MILRRVNFSKFSETVLDHNANRMIDGEATKMVKNVVTNIGGLFSGSRNLCCISGLSPLTALNKLPSIPIVINSVTIINIFLSMSADYPIT